MPSLTELNSSRFVKLIYIGDSGTGKTGSLASLAAAGYRLRILDMDNGLPVLRNFMAHDYPDADVDVGYMTSRDNYKSSPGGPIISGVPKAFVNATKYMTEWEDGTTPSEWGDNTIFVLDSLTRLGTSALAWAKGMNPGAKDGRQWYKQAQDALESILAMLTSDNFEAHVIVISHVKYSEVQGVTRGYANAIGTALGPIIPSYFNTMILAEAVGSGKTIKRTIRTVPTQLITLKTPAPFRIDDSYDLGTGMADIFKQLKEG